jgi:hypothetical protein
MKKHNIIGRFASLTLMISLLVASCKKEEQVVSPPLPENEFLTTVKLQLVNAATNDTVIAIWKDLTPEDTNPADTSLAVLNLKKNSTYQATILLLDETQNPAEDITEEIKERANYHQLFYFPSSSLGGNLVVNVTDTDTNSPPLPLGVTSNFITSNVANGKINVVLRHQPNVKNGTFAPGSTDVDVNFQVNIID